MMRDGESRKAPRTNADEREGKTQGDSKTGVLDALPWMGSCSTHRRSAPHPPSRGRCGAPTMQTFGKEARAVAGIVLVWKSE